jgi:hypothetical protein
VELAYKAAAAPAEPYDVQDAGDVTRLLRAQARGRPRVHPAAPSAPPRRLSSVTCWDLISLLPTPPPAARALVRPAGVSAGCCGRRA